MAKGAGPLQGVPSEEPSVQPRDLHDVSDIRFVMRETATLTERIDGLTKSIDQMAASVEKALEKQSADFKERIGEVKADIKDASGKITAMELMVSKVKGAMWLLSALFAFAVAVGGIALAVFK